MNKITTYYSGDLIQAYYKDKYPKWSTETSYRLRKVEIKTPCMLIFGPHQDELLACLKANLPKGKKIIFEGKKAVNQREGDWGGFHKRNTLIVIDKCEDEALPELP